MRGKLMGKTVYVDNDGVLHRAKDSAALQWEAIQLPIDGEIIAFVTVPRKPNYGWVKTSAATYRIENIFDGEPSVRKLEHA